MREIKVTIANSSEELELALEELRQLIDRDCCYMASLVNSGSVNGTVARLRQINLDRAMDTLKAVVVSVEDAEDREGGAE